MYEPQTLHNTATFTSNLVAVLCVLLIALCVVWGCKIVGVCEVSRTYLLGVFEIWRETCNIHFN